ncbi:MAG: DUF1080 domain-containing protein [Pirellulales bacterium]|nr:DUF1080 domain-containing protein [Pirellulales bacterium]
MIDKQRTCYAENRWRRDARPFLRRAGLATMLLALLGVLLFGQPIAAGPQQTSDSGANASASPSDTAPAPADAATETAKAACCPVCKPSRLRCGVLRARLRNLCRPCCCPPCRHRSEPAAEKPDPYAWQDLFDGKTLEGWKVPEFGGEGEVHIDDGAIVLEMGSEMTGIVYVGGEVPRENYEFAWEGARLDGIDFFATATFPVGKDECSLVTGGWGGMVVGISSVDFYYADDNVTTTFHEFKDKQWYKFRVRVTTGKIEAWIDGEQVVDLEREGRKIGYHDAVYLCRPLGISAWVTKGGVRNIRLRKLPPSDSPPFHP